MSIIDTPFKTTSKLACLSSNGVRTVLRYYNHTNSSVFPEKRLELAEAQAISAQGIQIGVVFQQRNSLAVDFSKVKGAAAGKRAYRHAHDNIGQPRGSAIYFGVDFDASPQEIAGKIVPYFEGVKEAFAAESDGNPDYRVGVYGSGLVASELRNRGLIELNWLSMSHGHRGTQAALAAGRFNLAQQPPAAHLCGLDLDFNNPNPDGREFGTFTV